MLKATFAQLAAELSSYPDFQWALPGELFVVWMGPCSAAERVFWNTGTHGQECAPPLALLRFARLYANDWPWPNVGIKAIVADAEAFDEVGYGFVGADGSRSSWPPMWGYRRDDKRYWSFVDNNSAWGNMAVVPTAHKILRREMDAYRPTFVLASHETVTNEPDRQPYWAGCGLMTIEAYPISMDEIQALIGIPNPAGDPIGFIDYLGRRWLWLLGLPRWKRNARILKDNEDYQLLTKVMERFRELGGRVMGHKWMRYQEAMGALAIGPGRVVVSPKADWMTVASYAARHYGCPAITTETFDPGEIGVFGLDQRIIQNTQFVTTVAEVLCSR